MDGNIPDTIKPDTRFRRLSGFSMFAGVCVLMGLLGLLLYSGLPTSALAAVGGLFAASFLAATLFPAQSEILLASLLLTQTYSPILLIAAASTGNVLGSWLNWFLGTRIEHFKNHRLFPVTPERLERTKNWYRRYGWWTLWLSWMPVIGDPLTLVAGVMREPLWRFLLVVTLAKTLRYTILAAMVLHGQAVL